MAAEDTNYEKVLAEGVAILIGAEGEIVAHRSSLPAVFLTNGPLLGRSISTLEPQGLAESLGRLWRRSVRSGAAESERLLVGLGGPQGDPVEALGLQVAPRADRDGLWGLTIRNLSGERSRTQSLLDQISGLEAQRDEWRTLARTSAHDIRSSLGAVTGFVKLALRKNAGADPEVVETLESALEAAGRVRSIAERVLRSDEAPAASFVPVVLGTMLQRLFAALRAAHPEVPFTWFADASDLCPAVPPDVLWEVLWNLASNAVQYRMPGRQLHIEAGVWGEESQIQVEVRDNGRGLSPVEGERIFEEGVRGSSAAGTEGTGLGLHSARGLLARWGAQLRALPSRQGAAFRLTLPRV